MSSPATDRKQVSFERVVVLEHQLAEVTTERDQLAHERDQYKAQAEWLQKQLERLSYDAKTPRERVDPRQIQLVFEPFARALLEATRPESDTSKPPEEGGPPEKKKRKITPHGRRVLPEHLPVETLVLNPSPLSEHAVQIGTEQSWRLGYRRASYYRLRILRPVYSVPKEEAEESTEVVATLISTKESAAMAVPASEQVATDATAPAQEGPERAVINDIRDTTIVYAPAPDEIVPRGLPTPDLLAHLLVGKFADKLPFNRQEGICARDGVPITRGTMCGWAEASHKLAHHVVDAMVEDGRQHAHVIATDATGVLVQANEKCKKGHFWVYVTDRDHVVFRYSSSHSSDEPKSFFKGFRGTVLSDASNVYDVLFGSPESPGEANCWSHARRYFYKAIESENRDEALVGVGFCNELFELERHWKKLPPSKRLVERRKRSTPVIEMLERWKDEQMANPHLSEGSRLRKALNYLTNQWLALRTFLDNGRLCIDNNESERQLRSLVIGRANWTFVGSDDTAPWTCTFVSLVASCQLHKIDPEGYLRDLFRVLPVWPKNRMLELAPLFWRETRARLDDAQMALPLGPLTVPEARPLREAAVAQEHA